MKKLIAVLTLFLAFSINVTAQEKKLAPSSDQIKELAQRDANDLTKLVGLTEAQNADFFRLFENKYRTLENKELSQERKDILAKVVEDKIRATLDAKQTATLEKNPELLKKLTH